MEHWDVRLGILKVLSNLWRHGSEGTQADRSPLLSTLLTNSTCLSQSDPCKYGSGNVKNGGGCRGAWLVTCSHIAGNRHLDQALGQGCSFLGP